MAPHILRQEIDVSFVKVLVDRTLQATPMHYFYAERLVDTDHPDAAAQVRRHCQWRVGALLGQLDMQLASHGQPWLLGADYSAADAYAFMLCRWTRGFEGGAGSETAPASSRPQLGPYLQRMLARPAVQRVLADKGLVQPWV